MEFLTFAWNTLIDLEESMMNGFLGFLKTLTGNVDQVYTSMLTENDAHWDGERFDYDYMRSYKKGLPRGSPGQAFLQVR